MIGPIARTLEAHSVESDVSHILGGADRIESRDRGYRIWLTIAPYACAFFVIAFLRQVTYGGDLWVRLATGRLVFETRDVPRVDSFSFSSYGAQWIDHEWIMGTVMYLMYRVHYEFVVISLALLALAPFVLMHRHVLKNGSNPWLPTVGVVAVAIASAWRNYPPRPALVNPFCFAVLLILIDSHRLRKMSDGRLTPALFAIPLLFVWANLQAGFMAGFAVLAVWNAVCFIERRDRRLALAVAVGSFCIGFLNAYGWHLYSYTIWASIGGSADRNVVQEWLSPDFHSVLNWPHAFGIVLVLWLGVGATEPFRRVILITTLMASLLSARFEPLFAVSLIFAIAPSLKPVAAPTRGQLRLLSYLALPFILLPAIFFFGTVSGASPSAHEPNAALAYVRREYPGVHVLATIGFSSWFTYEREPVFIDGRTSQVYSNEIVQDYFDLERVRGNWTATLDKYHINVMIVDRDSELEHALSNAGWQRVFVDVSASVLTRGAG